jgi:hypothetical protein
VKREEFERHVREELKFTEMSPGHWIGRMPIPGLPVIQPFPVFIIQKVLERREGSSSAQAPNLSAVVQGIRLSLRVQKNHEEVYEYMLGVNAARALGALILADDGEVIIVAATPCGIDPDRYFSREELAVMVASTMGIVQEHYAKLLQLIHADEPRTRTSILTRLGIGRAPAAPAPEGK